ncbi:hypothetical protein Mp_4g20160 [Marchantia polymorpha subsp. ruderalis]|uniref:Uncharacterized protein n=2 Tax=Marchantia polymorpha TaxID=3197 RepID=A0AAF6BBV9_MARPO|nr:hypothetical protein MARPO_0116s0018 [Marchantia polymorpha]BBN09493.1 hypothetical protein Mp_4g20160 [Marchantia polymorpha subsp. ruderalis]|eukprot:PTQ31029.1 hypothetical protein MARPO_0116s0018 [Marchantia polymorpha]
MGCGVSWKGNGKRCWNDVPARSWFYLSQGLHTINEGQGPEGGSTSYLELHPRVREPQPAPASQRLATKCAAEDVDEDVAAATSTRGGQRLSRRDNCTRCRPKLQQGTAARGRRAGHGPETPLKERGEEKRRDGTRTRTRRSARQAVEKSAHGSAILCTREANSLVSEVDSSRRQLTGHISELWRFSSNTRASSSRARARAPSGQWVL